jgi:hypothetical protein
MLPDGRKIMSDSVEGVSGKYRSSALNYNNLAYVSYKWIGNVTPPYVLYLPFFKFRAVL